MRRNVKLSKQWANAVDAKDKQCWANSVKAAYTFQAIYVEGWAVPTYSAGLSLPIEHGWCIFNGEIIDPSPAMLKQECEYFPGVEYSYELLIELIGTQLNASNSVEPPFVWLDSIGTFKDEDYIRARDRAYELAFGHGFMELFGAIYVD